MQTPPLKLAAEFPKVDHQDWVDLVNKSLHGKNFDAVMHKKAYDDIMIDALYTADNARIQPQQNSTQPGWDICQPYWGTDAKEANEALLTDLGRGATSLMLRVMAGGFPGMAISNFENVFAGIYLDMCAVQLVADEEFEAAGKAYLNLLDERDIVPRMARGTLGADPVGTLAVTGRLLTSLDDAVEAAAKLAQETAGRYPNVRCFNVAGFNYHGAGATPAQELSACLSIGVQYLRAMEAIGMDMTAAASQIQFTLAADADMYMTVAKFRALRRLWAQILAACGVTDSECTVNALTAARMMTVRDPWVNILRGTTACLAAGIGGADSITILPHDTMLGMPTDFSRRIARNIQVILQEEASLAQVMDPAAGSYALETLTTDLSEKSWEEFQALERDGGFAFCLKAGVIADALEKTWASRKERLATRVEVVTGVSEFPNIHEELPKSGFLPAFIEDVKPAGETMRALKFHRNAEDFEALRNISDKIFARKGSRPKVFLANAGAVSDHVARATFARNFFEAGGIEAVSNDGFADNESMIKAFRQSGADMAVLCGRDVFYETEGDVTVAALKEAGCGKIYVAGRPKNFGTLTDAGVTDFIFTGANVLNVLQAAMANEGEK